MNNQAKNVIKNTGTRSLTCIICPRGCLLEVELGENIAVSGNLCPRGKVYAENECTNPQRTVTSTVRWVKAGPTGPPSRKAASRMTRMGPFP